MVSTEGDGFRDKSRTRLPTIAILLVLSVSTLALATSSPIRSSAGAVGGGTYFAIYYAAVVSGNTSYLNIFGNVVPVKGGTAGVFSYIPELNSSTLVATSTSVSYSPSTFDVYTAGDRIYFITMHQISMTTGDETANVEEVDLTNGKVSGSQFGSGFWVYSPETYAAVNDSFYFHPGSWYEVATGAWEGNGFYVANVTSNSETQLLSAGDSQNYGALVSTGGSLFRYEFASKNATAKCSVTCFLDINQINLETGQNGAGVQLNLPGSYYNGTFSGWSFTASKSELYVAAMLNPNNNKGTLIGDTPSVWVWTIPMVEFESGTIPNGPENNWFDTINAFVPIPTVTPAGLESIQASHGDLLVNMNGSLVLYTMPPASCSTFQSCTGNSTVIPGTKIDASLVYGQKGPNTASSSSTSTSTSSSTSTTASTSSIVTTSGAVTTSSVVTASRSTTSTSPTSSYASGGLTVTVVLPVAVMAAALLLCRRTRLRRRSLSRS